MYVYVCMHKGDNIRRRAYLGVLEGRNMIKIHCKYVWNFQRMNYNITEKK